MLDDIDALKKEIKKQTPSFDIIKDKMKRTCEYRQLFCHAHTTAEVLEEFPCLRLNIFFTADVLLLYGVDVTNLKMKLVRVRMYLIIYLSSQLLDKPNISKK